MMNATKAHTKEHDHTMTSKKTMNSKRSVVAKGRVTSLRPDTFYRQADRQPLRTASNVYNLFI
jgi:hypothetical protein